MGKNTHFWRGIVLVSPEFNASGTRRIELYLQDNPAN